MTTTQAMWAGAWQTLATLGGGLAIGILVGNTVFAVLPGSSVSSPQTAYALVAAVPTLAVFALGSAAWGRAMARLAAAPMTSRMSWAGILGFAPITLLLALALFALEPIAVERLGHRFPIHRLFTFLFVPTAFIIAAVAAGAIGIGLRDRLLAWSLAWRVGLTAGVAFLSVNMIMESAGWVVGAPGAAKRATMITVMGLGNLAAAVTGGAVLGRSLALRPAVRPAT